ncbi:Methyltransferase domain-containing protein [Aspergillus sp. HF37]|nr:Methyltransferase domain-containing protein [Aspergillus sp. HF37]
MSPQMPTNDLLLGQARQSHSVQHCMDIYDKWAATYNDEVGDEAQSYVAPVLVAQAALQSTNNPSKSVVLDAGCGTGLVGQALAMIGGVKTIDGLDLSAPMLTVAKKTGVYRDLDQADLTRRIEKPDNTYDTIVCVGTFTLGHVGPDPALREFVRITKGNGIIAATILEDIWISGGFKTEVEKLKAEGVVNVLADGLIDYVKGHGDKAMLVVLEKNNDA